MKVRLSILRRFRAKGFSILQRSSWKPNPARHPRGRETAYEAVRPLLVNRAPCVSDQAMSALVRRLGLGFKSGLGFSLREVWGLGFMGGSGFR